MRIALFTDACCKPKKGVTGLAAVAFDVTDPNNPRELFARTVKLPHCDSTEAELRAALFGVQQVLPGVLHGNGAIEVLTLFTDSEAVTRNLERLDTGKRVRSAADIVCTLRDELAHVRIRGCQATIEVIPRKLNRRADILSRAATNGEIPPPSPIPETPPLLARYPFLTTLNR